ncbi:MAG: hypothetical protein HY015_03085 [Bacteroidetes bacterium]|nr:hypothetical protein [Bacteroidota bacterium]MBI3481951.1 hypothetical protein [Bacteroidota bacterium]
MRTRAMAQFYQQRSNEQKIARANREWKNKTPPASQRMESQIEKVMAREDTSHGVEKNKTPTVSQ